MSLMLRIKELRNEGHSMPGAVDLARYERFQERLPAMRAIIENQKPSDVNGVLLTLLDHIEELYEHTNLGADLGRRLYRR